jgi:hypothetical protein
MSILMTAKDTFDITLISVIESLLQLLMKRNRNPARYYRLEKIHTALMKYESLYEGNIPEEYATKADRFDDTLSTALTELQTS